MIMEGIYIKELQNEVKNEADLNYVEKNNVEFGTNTDIESGEGNQCPFLCFVLTAVPFLLNYKEEKNLTNEEFSSSIASMSFFLRC